MKPFAFLATLGVIIMLSSCSRHPIEHYTDTTPIMDIKDYFTGPIKAWGVVQDWRGRVTRRFDIDMVGTWKGDTGTLVEHFKFYDGETTERVWTIKKRDNGRYEGTAFDILDTANGQTNGNAARWNYYMDLPVGNTTYRLKFDDWMFLLNDGVLLNRSYMKKFGITVAELSIFMKKQ